MNTELIEENVHRLVGAMTGAATTAMVAVGDQLGLYRALADGGPATEDELAARTGMAARYLREWLSQQAAAGFLAYREGDGRYVLPAEAAAVLADEASPAFLAGGATITRGWFAGIDRLAEAFRTGDGIPWHEQDPAVFEGTERFFRPGYTASLTTEWVPALDGVAGRLADGGRVADVGCGHGVAAILLARAYPQASIHGYDFHDRSIQVARQRAVQAGLGGRIRFEPLDATSYLQRRHRAPAITGRRAGCAPVSSPRTNDTSAALPAATFSWNPLSWNPLARRRASRARLVVTRPSGKAVA